MHSAEEALHGNGSQRRHCCGVSIANFPKTLPIQIFAIARRQRFAFDQAKCPPAVGAREQSSLHLREIKPLR